MKKTSIYLDPELDTALAARADEQGLTKAELIRRTLADSIHRRRRPPIKGIGFVTDGPSDLSANFDDYLWGGPKDT